MKAEYKDFIGIYSDVFEEGFCSHVISEFERNRSLGAGSDRFQEEGAQKHYKDDYFIFNNGRDIVFEKCILGKTSIVF